MDFGKVKERFFNSYPDAHFKVITPNNIEDFLSVE